MCMKNIIVLGNGESRLKFDLKELKKLKIPIWGCNAIYRDTEKINIIATDRPLMLEILKSKRLKKNTYYFDFETWEEITDPKLKNIKGIHSLNPPYKYTDVIEKRNTGAYAIYIVSFLYNPKNIFLFGFDFGSPDETKINNIYFNTVNYRKKGDNRVYYHNQVNGSRLSTALEKIKGIFRTIDFYRVECFSPQLENYNFGEDLLAPNITYKQFLEKINENSSQSKFKI